MKRASWLWAACVLVSWIPTEAETIVVPRDYPTLQAAVDAADDGDVVKLAGDRTYRGPGFRDVDLRGKAIVVRGKATLDCEGLGRGFIFQSGEGRDTVIRGLRIIRGAADHGAGVYCLTGSPRIIDCDFEECVATDPDSMGGAVYCGKGTLAKFEKCNFINNTAQRGGAMFLAERADAEVSQSSFMGNSAIEGGAVHAAGSSARFSACQFRQNHGQRRGGGFYGIGAGQSPTPILTDCVFEANSSDEGAGGLYCVSGCSPVVVGCSLRGNQAPTGAGVFLSERTSPHLRDTDIENNGGPGTFRGGGLYINGSDAHILNCSIKTNESTYGGGAWMTYGNPMFMSCEFRQNRAEAGGGGVSHNGEGFAEFVDCHIDDNYSLRGGSGIDAGAYSRLEFRNCTVTRNLGLGIQCIESIALFSGCIISENARGGVRGVGSGISLDSCVLFANYGGNALQFDGCDVTLGNCSVVNNFSGADAVACGRGCDVSIVNSILWENGPVDVDSACDASISYTAIRDWPGEGNIDNAPRFADWPRGDLRLLPDSPCIDAGSSRLALDLTVDADGRIRRVDTPRVRDTGEGPAPIVDMGAFERRSRRACAKSALLAAECVDGQVGVEVTGGAAGATLTVRLDSDFQNDVLITLDGQGRGEVTLDDVRPGLHVVRVLECPDLRGEVECE